MTKKAVIYARTACINQGDNTKIESQIQACSSLAKKSGLTIVEIVSHHGTSGDHKTEGRLVELVRLCKRKRAKTLITHNTDRLSRKYADCVHFLLLLKAYGIDLLTTDSNKNGLTAILENHYKTALSQKIRKGIVKARKQ